MVDNDFGAATARFDFGRLVSRTFSIISRNFIPFFLVALILEGIPTFLSSAIPLLAATGLSFGLGDLYATFSSWSLSAGALALVITGGIIVFALYMLAYTTLVGALIHASVQGFKGEEVRIRESLRIGWRFVWPLIGYSILSVLGIGLGLLLFVIPGLILICMWMVGSAVVVMEGNGVTDAFGRSLELTSGRKWWVFLFFIMYLAAVFFISVIGEALAMPMGLGEFNIAIGGGVSVLSAVMYSLIQALIAIATVILSSAGIASLYYELCVVKDGGFSDSLTSVFD